MLVYEIESFRSRWKYKKYWYFVASEKCRHIKIKQTRDFITKLLDSFLHYVNQLHYFFENNVRRKNYDGNRNAHNSI